MTRTLCVLAASLVSATALVTVAQAQDPIKVGVSWSNFQEERWKTDEAAIKAALEAAGTSPPTPRRPPPSSSATSRR